MYGTEKSVGEKRIRKMKTNEILFCLWVGGKILLKRKIWCDTKHNQPKILQPLAIFKAQKQYRFPACQDAKLSVTWAIEEACHDVSGGQL